MTATCLRQRLDQLETLSRHPPPDGAERAYAIWRHHRRARAPGKGKKASPRYLLKQLPLDISDAWTQLWRYTNNTTQRAIGRFLTIRLRPMRGFIVKDHIPACFIGWPGSRNPTTGFRWPLY